VDRKVLRQLERKRKKLKKRAREGNSAKRRNLAWTALQLTDEDREWLGHLPETLSFRAEDQEILAVHGSPLGDTDYLYASLTETGLEAKLRGYEGPPPTLLVAGHSHVPFARSVNGTLVMNCGSVGLPADGDPRGSLLVADISAEGPTDVELVRFHYPVEEVEAAIEEREVPGVDPSQYGRGIKL
jgi:predicted phosphodiesterase